MIHQVSKASFGNGPHTRRGGRGTGVAWQRHKTYTHTHRHTLSNLNPGQDTREQTTKRTHDTRHTHTHTSTARCSMLCVCNGPHTFLTPDCCAARSFYAFCIIRGLRVVAHSLRFMWLVGPPIRSACWLAWWVRRDAVAQWRSNWEARIPTEAP